jgi:hypothetical protein
MNAILTKQKLHVYAVKLDIGWVGEIYLEDKWYAIAARSEYPFTHFEHDRQFDIAINRLKQKQMQFEEATLNAFLEHFGSLPKRLNTTYSGRYIQQAGLPDQNEGNQSQEAPASQPKTQPSTAQARRSHTQTATRPTPVTKMKWTGPICCNKRSEVVHADS